MSTAEEKAWAHALATKYGIREPASTELTEHENYAAFWAYRAWTTGTAPISTAA